MGTLDSSMERELNAMQQNLAKMKQAMQDAEKSLASISEEYIKVYRKLPSRTTEEAISAGDAIWEGDEWNIDWVKHD